MSKDKYLGDHHIECQDGIVHIGGGTGDVTTDNTTGYLIIGDAEGTHLAFDNNEILARDGSTASGLYLGNEDDSTVLLCKNGGSVGIGTGTPAKLFEVSTDTASVGPACFTQYTNDDDGPNIWIRRGRGTQADPLIVEDEDYIGSVDFSAYDGVDFNSWAYVKARVDGDVSGGEHLAKLVFGTDDGTGLDTKMTIKADGKVGIGTYLPATELEVVGTITAGPILIDHLTTEWGLHIKTGGDLSNSYRMIKFENQDADSTDMPAWTISHRDGGSFNIGSDWDDPKFFIEETGRIGIGTNDPAGLLALSSDADSSNVYVSQYVDGTAGPNILLRKAQGESGDASAVEQNDVLGTIDFMGHNGSSFKNAAQVRAMASADFGTAVKGRLIFETNDDNDNPTIRMVIDHDGLIGMGSGYFNTYPANLPLADLHIHQSANPAIVNGTGPAGTTGGLILQGMSANNYWHVYQASGSSELCFNFNGVGDYGGYLETTAVGAISVTFTGQHRSDCSDELKTSDNVGLIVTAKGVYKNLDGGTTPSINESLPDIELSSNRNDKKVFGVISDIEDENGGRKHSSGIFVSVFEKNDTRLIINSLGEGAIWVTNVNGDLENGDYITSCEIPGYGMRQDDDLLHNYTVAKITQDCNFDLAAANYTCEEFVHEGTTYRKAFVGCTYHCG